MPNWCSIEFTVQGTPEELEKFKVGMEGTEEAEDGTVERSAFDFNKLILRPTELDIESGTYGLTGYDVFYGPGRTMQYPWVAEKGITTVEQLRDYLNEENPRYYEMGTLYHQNIQKYGVPTWYEWSIQNWGVKWNPSEVYLEELDNGFLRYCFSTAWDFPEPIFHALAEKYPNVFVEGTMDEESGGFHGEFYLQHGSCDVDYNEGPRHSEEDDGDDEDDEPVE